MSFDDVSLEPDQTFDLQKDVEGVLEYTPKWVFFYLLKWLDTNIVIWHSILNWMS